MGTYLSSCSFSCFALFGFVCFGYGVPVVLCCSGGLIWFYLRCLHAYRMLEADL